MISTYHLLANERRELTQEIRIKEALRMLPIIHSLTNNHKQENTHLLL